MKNKIALLSTSIVVALLGTSGCSSEAYEYEVSGVVEDGRLDYDCPNSLSMESASFVIRAKGRSSTSAKAGGRSRGGSSSSRSKTSSGSKLPNKPTEPERVPKIPSRGHGKKSKGCKVEYELYIKNSDGLFEQDVRQVDYDKCLDRKRERFPACTDS
ncbi:hypothetical protein [Streptomyces cucumeris]|uniref:hypothetical protein n=1 Tax=Streptomyces cucumeris TaxID=2962890 RepID=UPI0020C919A6|nr:hypothetical protein [Streptomyces sp. NEAU-Y11]MCP9209670.1 hypothetical protein [Streptomyces sp. NEAU-Y11]